MNVALISAWSDSMIKNYLKIALRNILRQKGYSFINIAGLTMGLACFILIGLWVRDELSFDRFHENKDRIFRILNKVESGEFIPSPTYALADRNSILLTETTARKYFGDDEPLGKVLFLDEYNGGSWFPGLSRISLPTPIFNSTSWPKWNFWEKAASPAGRNGWAPATSSSGRELRPMNSGPSSLMSTRNTQTRTPPIRRLFSP